MADAGDSPTRGARGNVAVIVAAAVLLAAAVVGVILVFRFVEAERERDLRAWQVRMAIVADSRVAAVEDWVARQFQRVGEIARNASIELYMTELALVGGDETRVTDGKAQRGYLRNLLVAAADAGGFSGPLRGPAVDANVERAGVAGLAVVDNEGRIIVATPAMPEIDAAFRERIVANRGERVLYDLHLDAGGAPAMGFGAPIFAIQSDRRASDQLGMVVGIKEVADGLYPLLEQPGAVEATAEAVLVRPADGGIEYLSPLADGARALERELAHDTPGLAAAFALERPGGFAIRRDYRDARVLVVSRRVAGTPWTLMYKIDVAEALSETIDRLRRLLTVFLLAIAAVAIALVAAWWYGTSRRASDAARRASDLAARLETQRDFLRLVTDSQPAAMAIVDRDGRYLWANRKSAEQSGLAPEEVVGKTLAAVVGPAPAKALLATVRRVLEQGTETHETLREEREGETRTFSASFVPLAPTETLPPRVLIASEDVTDVVEERARRERIMDQLVTTLVGVVDRRDPNSAGHSAWVARIARTIAEEMSLDPVETECVEIAGRVMNLGKIAVPEHVLTKSTPLTDDELVLVRASVATSAELLEGVEFDGPVVATLHALAEHPGNSAFTADDVPLTARIVAAANAFVAMVSPRAYRDQLSIDAALDALGDRMGAGDSRRVLSALANWLDNRGGRAALADVGRAPPPA